MNDKRRSDPPKPASSEDALAFVRDLQEKFLKPNRSRADDRRLQTYLSQRDPETLRSIASRVMIDVLKCPPSVDRRGDGGRAAPGPASPPDQGNASGKGTKVPSPRKRRRPAGVR